MEGTFEGVLVCNNGSVYIGPQGVLITDLRNCDIVIVEGTVKGNIQGKHIIMRGDATVEGSVTGDSVEMGPNVELHGQMTVTHKTKRQSSTSPTKREPHLKTNLLLLDPQTDFHDEGAMAVPDASDDAKRCAKFIRNNKDSIDEIFVSMDSHHRMHIAHGVFWIDESGESPPPYTVILNEHIEAGKWRPRDDAPDILEYVKYYTKELEARGKVKLTIWPEHCLIGSPGHSVVPVINDALQEWATGNLNTVTYIMKGTNCLTEMYSALSAEVEIASDPSTHLDAGMVERLTSGDRLLVCGQSLSHTVAFTVRDIVRHADSAQAARVVVLEDGCSALPGYDGMAREFIKEMKEMGIQVCNFSDVKMSPSTSDTL